MDIGSNAKDIVMLVISIGFGIAGNYLFYWRQKKDLNALQVERVQRARVELVDTLESMVINKQGLSPEVIHTLGAAVARKHMVSFGTELNVTIQVLQDVTLRLQESKHLDINQKSQYIDLLLRAIQSMSSSQPEKRSPVEGELAGLLDSLDQYLNAGDTEKAAALLAQAKDSVQSCRAGDPTQPLSGKSLSGLSLPVMVLGSTIALLFQDILYPIIRLAAWGLGYLTADLVALSPYAWFLVLLALAVVVAVFLRRRARNDKQVR